MFFIMRILYSLHKTINWFILKIARTRPGKSLTKHMGNFSSFLAKCIILWLISCILLTSSIVIYFTLHYSIMPIMLLSVPVHFQFGGCYENEQCTHPLGRVSLLDGTGVPVLHPHVLYTVNLDIDMPESEVNQFIGMFSIQLNMTDIQGRLLSSVTRANILRYRSSLHHTIRTAVFSPLLLSGYLQEQQAITTVLHTGMLAYEDRPPTTAWLLLRPGHIQLYTARLRVHARLRGLRRLMYQYPLLAGLLGTGAIFFSMSLTFLVVWARSYAWPNWRLLNNAARSEQNRVTQARPDQSKQEDPEESTEEIEDLKSGEFEAVPDGRDQLLFPSSCSDEDVDEQEPCGKASADSSGQSSLVGGWMHAVTSRVPYMPGRSSKPHEE